MSRRVPGLSVSASLGWWEETSDDLVESSLRVAIATSEVMAGIAPITAIAYRRIRPYAARPLSVTLAVK